MMATLRQRLLVLPLLLGGGALGSGHVLREVDVPANLGTRALGRDAYGYSVEPVWLASYVNSSLMATLLGEVARVAGRAPPIRIGGTTSDQTTLYESLPGNATSSSSSGAFAITPGWFDAFAGYFPPGTDLVFCLNFADNSSSWANARATAAAAWQALGGGAGSNNRSTANLRMFELGNEIDHFADKGWRAPGWGVAEYIPQFRSASAGIRQAEWYVEAEARGEAPPKFQAAVFADPPWVPDQQDEIDDFDIVNLTRGGLVDPQHEVVAAYSVHLYPQSSCDAARWHRMRLDLLSNHTALWLNVSQYGPQVAAADAARTPLVLGETNSVSCGGRSGISDTFGAALWGADYVLLAASLGLPRVYFHLGAQSQYAAFTPWGYTVTVDGNHTETLTAGIRANFYSHYFIAHVVQGLGEADDDDAYQIAALPGANASDLSGYAVYRQQEEEKQKQLAKLVFLDMGVWNGTAGLGNPSTLGSTDGAVFSAGPRPRRDVAVTTPWAAGRAVAVVRLQGPGTNAKSLVNVSGVAFDGATGRRVGGGDPREEVVAVGAGGVVRFGMVAAEGVLLSVV